MRSKPFARPSTPPAATTPASRQTEATRPPAKPRRRWGWYFLFLFMLATTLLFFAPNIVSQTALKEVLLQRATRGYPLTLNVGKLHLSWFSPIVVGDVSLADERGEALARVTTIQTHRTLLAIASDWQHIGRILVDQPVVNLQLHENGSNWETFIASLPPSTSKSETAMDVVVEVVNGTVEINDTANRQTWQLGEINALADVPGSPFQVHGTKLQCVIDLDGKRVGNVQVEGAWQAEDDTHDSPMARGYVTLASQNLPLEIADLGLRRAGQAVQLGGQLTCNCRYEWTNGGKSQKAAIQELTATQFLLRAPQWLNQDEFQTSSLVMAGEVTIENGVYHFQKLKIDSDMLVAEADGVLALSGVPVGNPSWIQWLHQDCNIRGEIDLPQLARTLPRTLHLRDDTRVASGTVTVSLASSSENGARNWQGVLESTQLVASAGGHHLKWDKPIRVALIATDQGSGPTIQELTCKSSFLDLQASGSLDQGSLKASANLDQLVAEIGKLVEFGDLRLAGQLAADLDWQVDQNDLIKASAEATVKKFELASRQLTPWREDKLVINAEALVTAGRQGIGQVQDALLRVESGQDRLQINLLEPVSGLSGDTPWKAKGQLVGSLGTWLPRLQPFVTLAGWDMRGAIDTQITVFCSGGQFDVPEIKMKLEQLQVQGPGLNLTEPRVQLDAVAHWDRRTNELSAGNVTLASSTVALRGENLVLRSGSEGPQLTGDAGFRADLSRLADWFSDPKRGRTTKLSGMATGQLKMNHEAGVSKAVLSTDISDLVVSTKATPTTGVRNASDDGGWKAAWDEKRLSLSGQAMYDAPRSTIQLTKIEIASKAFNANTSGTIVDPAGECKVDLSGTIAYDWQNVGALLRPYTGDLLWIEGEENREFVVRGPLFVAGADRRSTSNIRAASTSRPAMSGPLVSDDLQAATRLGWKSANYSGFAIGPGELDAKLERGVLNLGPLDVQVSGGQLHLAPQVLLNASPTLITMPPGIVADKVDITPEMCQTWLKFLAPLLADATLAEGSFSLALDDAQVPAANPMMGVVRGTLTIHEARIGPGPMSRELLWLAAQVKAVSQRRPFDPNLQLSNEWLEVPEQKIDFEVAQGRVYNKGIAFHVKDVDIRTHGSVGFDQSLLMTAEVPIKDEWVAKEKFLASLRGQTLQVPIGGTASKPKLDYRALTDLSKQAVSGAAMKLLEDELGKGLDKLLRPKK